MQHTTFARRGNEKFDIVLDSTSSNVLEHHLPFQVSNSTVIFDLGTSNNLYSIVYLYTDMKAHMAHSTLYSHGPPISMVINSAVGSALRTNIYNWKSAVSAAGLNVVATILSK